MVRHGMTPARAIRSATLDAARLLGREDRVGSIAADKLADLIAVRGDPLADLTLLAALLWILAAGIAFFACYTAVFAWMNDGASAAARPAGATLPFAVAFAASGCLFHLAAGALRAGDR